MRTRGGVCYPRVGDVFLPSEKRLVVKRRDFDGEHMARRKRKRISPDVPSDSDLFDALPDDLVIYILCKLSSTATCPSDLINVLITYAVLFLPPPFLVSVFHYRDPDPSTGILIGITVLGFLAICQSIIFG